MWIWKVNLLSHCIKYIISINWDMNSRQFKFEGWQYKVIRERHHHLKIISQWFYRFCTYKTIANLILIMCFFFPSHCVSILKSAPGNKVFSHVKRQRDTEIVAINSSFNKLSFQGEDIISNVDWKRSIWKLGPQMGQERHKYYFHSLHSFSIQYKGNRSNVAFHNILSMPYKMSYHLELWRKGNY